MMLLAEARSRLTGSLLEGVWSIGGGTVVNKLADDVIQKLPEGTVTFLFTDIEGSTKLLRLLGDDYAIVIAYPPDNLR